MKLLTFLATLVITALPVSLAMANNPPMGATTTITNSTITTTNTFQQVEAQNTFRHGCLLQNQGTHVMYVFFGATASATLASSVQVLAGQTISCNVAGGIVLWDAVQITGTSGDAFVYNKQ